MQGRCEVCGNNYDSILEIKKDGRTRYFDSFECAIHALAPRCQSCDCRVIGHGVEIGEIIYCCKHCATQSSMTDDSEQRHFTL